MFSGSTVPPIHLSIEHLDQIYDLVKEDAAHWPNIGLKLGFLAGELEVIQNMPTLIVKGPEAYLKELLTRWLRRVNPLPLLGVLGKAIHDAGNERLGWKLVDRCYQESARQLQT